MDKMLTYSVVERKNPNMADMPGKYYAMAQARGIANIRELSERIQKMCTVTRADVLAVLVALEDVIADCLANGEIVRLGELGSLQVSLSGRGTDKPEDYHDGLIDKAKILFRSGTTLATMLATLKYEKVEQRPVKKKADGSEPVTAEPQPQPGEEEEGGV